MEATKSNASLRPEAQRFSLSGRSRQFDPRIHAIRTDLADIAAAEWRFAPHYAKAELFNIAEPSAMVRAVPSSSATATSQLLFGEGFAMLDERGGWAWGYCTHDHYVGYVPIATLAAASAPDHVVIAREAPIFEAPTIKAPVAMTLTIGARLSGTIQDGFLHCEQGYVHIRHVAPDTQVSGDPVGIGERLIGAPYLWGGRGAGGIDCSGLIQLALGLTGIGCPRDSDQQLAALGRGLAEGEQLARGDLVFFPGHVGIMANETNLLHANAHWMAVVIEPLADVVDRLRLTYEQPVTGTKRLKS